PGVLRIKDQLKAYADTLLKNYDVTDIASRKELLTLQVGAAIIDNRWDDVMAICDQIQAAQEKPSAKAMTCLITRSYARAAKGVGEDSPTFPDRFEQELRESTAKLDWTVTQDELQELRAQFQVMSRNLILGSLQALDANAAAQNNKVGVGFGADII